MDYKTYLADKGVSVREAARAMRKVYPSYNSSTQCMVNNPERYGVRLVRDADKLLIKTFGPDTEINTKSSAPNRTKPHRLVVYLDSRVFALFNTLKSRAGYSTAQDTLEALVRSWAATGGLNAEALYKTNKDLRNELCLKCGKCKESYLGACDGCRWKG